MTDKDKEVAHIEKLRDSAKNRILNFPLNVVEYNRADGKHGFLRDSAILAQTEALLAISEELALIRENLQNRQQKTASHQPAPPPSPPTGQANSAAGTSSGQNWRM
ncbi:hypothetical protein [Mycobacteroides abscessus]|uniref:hypothetical protein n=1 Tax=Mycobacteroides abscessus TaxID=36809 RepID=UPI0002FBA17C|nr:hypothetical protein [Mycobacteroides abscessus]RIT50863.1 hypothetical protein D2E80_05420 [Mycobacteroides abscessus]SKT64807.1 Uncharacterised protein [Mycobacteroides abscessus subsp. massiliense]SKT85752.1 Uncharacterised protein [Mycobacteroides abscessus subsp. massiliense]SKU37966.1 Uncharacterised protein [Mycobacteroides abscessus subsp. massiliense]SKY08944.1 Uncharacterised protein [Mycobacteroides abscessus subsp. massiliense]